MAHALRGGPRGKLRKWAELEFGWLTCESCIDGTLRDWMQAKGVQITIEGDQVGDYLAPVPVIDRGVTRYKLLRPGDGLPVCDNCEKPLLEPENQEVVRLFYAIVDQRERNQFSGHLYGLRWEVVESALAQFHREGQIGDVDGSRRRLWLLDSVYRQKMNEEIDRRSESKGAGE